MHWSRVVLVALAFPAVSARSQARPFTQPVDSGALVRLIPTTGEPLEGRLLARLSPGADSVRYCRYPGNPCTARDSDGVRATALASLQQVEITKGTRADRGMLIGATIGAGLGLLLGAAAQAECDASCPDAATAATIMGVGGLLSGALFGSTAKVWRPAP